MEKILFFLFWILLIFAFFLLVDFISGKFGAKNKARLVLSIVLTVGFTIGTIYYAGSHLSTTHDSSSAPDKAFDTAKSSEIPKNALHDVIGMRKAGVIKTLGLPFDTLSAPGTDHYEEWRYKIGEHKGFDVIIVDGKVKQVLDSVLFK
ncbi:MAG TPA: hypothetical protein VFX22_10825 [Candidatus Kapabacteria bacterium]|nr:hypothetical protein [Candidatus Kapabacteria bacterium]